MREVEIAHYDFLTRKYGDELLVDLGRVESLPGYVLDDTPHRLGFYEAVFLTRGAGEFAIDFRSHPVAPGHVFFTSPGQIRQWRLTAPAEGYTLFFTGGFVTEFFSDPLFLHKLRFFHNHRQPLFLPLRPAEFAEAYGRLREMEHEFAALGGDSVHMLRAILYQLLVRLNREYGAAYGTATDTEAHPVLTRFRSLLEERFREQHSVREYARMLHVTPGHLSDLARRHAGGSAGELIRGRVLVEAKRLLLYSPLTTAAVAARLGFADPSYFGRFFRRETGLPPGEYRARILEKYQDRPAP
jgi:AraC family transcriptional activator of pobA